MRFHLPEETEMIREAVRQFAENELSGSARLRDEEERFDRPLLNKAASLGTAGIPWPESYGGAGGNWLDYAVAIEEIARHCASTAAALAFHTAYASLPVYKYGSEEQRSEHLRALAGGVKLGAGLYGSWRLDSLKGDEGGCLLNGSIPFVHNGGAADLYIVFAKRGKALDCFLVEEDTPGLLIGPRCHKLGLRSLQTSDVALENCVMSERNRIGKAGQGREIALAVLDAAHVGIAALAVGIAGSALEAAVAYAKERKQFGKPIARQQGVSFPLADMAVRIDASRLLAYQSAWRMDAGFPSRKEAAMAKRYAVETAVAATIAAVQVFGGYGYMREYKVERYMRDAKCLDALVQDDQLTGEAVLSILAR